MIACPLCQNQQARGHECDVCGRPFPEHLVRETGQEDVVVEPVPGLETTMHDAPPPAESAASPDSGCNWCGHRQQAGRVCERCGMQRLRGKGPEPAESGDADEEELGYCGECGFESPLPRCFNCGSVLESA